MFYYIYEFHLSSSYIPRVPCNLQNNIGYPQIIYICLQFQKNINKFGGEIIQLICKCFMIEQKIWKKKYENFYYDQKSFYVSLVYNMMKLLLLF